MAYTASQNEYSNGRSLSFLVKDSNQSRSLVVDGYSTFQLLQAAKLCREPTVVEWWAASHTSGSEQNWSTPFAKDVLVSNHG